MKKRVYQPETKIILESLEKSALKSWEKHHVVSDKLVWHYTDTNGLISILKYGTIRVSNASYLNDSLELQHAKNLVYALVLEKIKHSTDTCLTEFFEQIEVSMRIAEMISQPLVGCFSGERGKDLLSQWRAYGDSGKGYALGFKPHQLPDDNLITKLRKVIYDEAEQAKIIKEQVEKYSKKLQILLSASTSKTAYKNEFVRDFSHSLATILHEYISCFKHPSWEAEHEVRLVYSITPFLTAKKIPNPSDIEFRTSQSGLIIPFKDIDVRKEDPIDFKMRLPLKKIIVGPKLNFQMAKNSIDQILSKLEYGSSIYEPHFVEIKRSNSTLV
jgi:hypothetical protein